MFYSYVQHLLVRCRLNMRRLGRVCHLRTAMKKQKPAENHFMSRCLSLPRVMGAGIGWLMATLPMLFFLGTAGTPSAVQAQTISCASDAPSFYNISVPSTLNVGADMPVGAVVWSQSISPTFTVRCSPITGGTMVFSASSTTPGAGLNFSQCPYTTPVVAPGFSDAYRIMTTSGQPTPLAVRIRTTPPSPGVGFTGTPAGTKFTPSVTVEVIRVTSAGGNFSGPVAVWTHLMFSWSPSSAIQAALFTTFASDRCPSPSVNTTISVGAVVPTCTVATPSVTIPLGNIQATAMPSVGSFAGSGTQNVSLNCTDNPAVTMSLTGTPVSGYSDVLALTSAPGVAQGVGAQLLYNGTPLTINGSVSLGTAGSTLTVPISARYYRTGNLTAGSANAIGTLNFTYQ
ncbi:MAG TPA: fimbrial protein [Dyella sp.]|uniref:fimbrial protein n=1 Tax=Dyella sp. TaxID=1869338 RepID=UPI002C0ED36E|nr:fimbrial protein [Dyella sp.]HTV87247.1 fimbrial protein [Dyella sp.]